MGFDRQIVPERWVTFGVIKHTVARRKFKKKKKNLIPRTRIGESFISFSLFLYLSISNSSTFFFLHASLFCPTFFLLVEQAYKPHITHVIAELGNLQTKKKNNEAKYIFNGGATFDSDEPATFSSVCWFTFYPSSILFV